jgi:hypothetical protein
MRHLGINIEKIYQPVNNFSSKRLFTSEMQIGLVSVPVKALTTAVGRTMTAEGEIGMVSKKFCIL